MQKPSIDIPAPIRYGACVLAIMIYLPMLLVGVAYSPWATFAVVLVGGAVFIWAIWHGTLLPPYYLFVIILAMVIWPAYLLAAWLLSRVMTISHRPYRDCLASLPFIS